MPDKSEKMWEEVYSWCIHHPLRKAAMYTPTGTFTVVFMPPTATSQGALQVIDWKPRAKPNEEVITEMTPLQAGVLALTISFIGLLVAMMVFMSMSKEG